MTNKPCRFLLSCVLTSLLTLALTFSACAIEPGHQCDDDAAVQCSADGYSLIASCSSCGELYDASVRILLEDGASFNCKPAEIQVDDAGWSDLGAMDYVVLYEGTGETVYPLTEDAPTATGSYTVSLSLRYLWESRDLDMVEIYRTVPVTFFINGHEWQYSASEYTINASCSHCGEHASVTIDTSAVYEASRNCDTSALRYEIFYENNWSNQQDIAHYNVLYYGYEVKSPSSTTQYVRTTQKPTETGSYSVKLALLRDENDTESAYVSTKLKSFYVADIPISQCQVLEYGPTQISQFTEPEVNSVNGWRYVGTLSEFLWCVYNGSPDDTIYLTDDIIVNPITVTDDGKVRAASYKLYNWKGFGSTSSEFTGQIIGNGHTIYGIYHPAKDSSGCSGLINAGVDCSFRSLTVENSLISNTNAGIFFGRYRATDGMNCHMESLTAWNCYVNADSAGGAIIGSYRCDGGGWTTSYFDSCVTKTTVTGAWAGGIIGACESDHRANKIMLYDCINYGDIRGVQYDGGGIIGALNVRDGGNIYANRCINTGSLYGKNYAGGIIAYACAPKALIRIYNCTSIGYVDIASGIKSGIVGAADEKYYNSSVFEFQSNYYYDAPSAYGRAPSGYQDATMLTPKQVKSGWLCEKYGHQANLHFTKVVVAGCENDGSMQKVCSVCGTVLETKQTKAHGHYYEWGECIYCHQTKDTGIGSMFVQSRPAVIAALIGILAAAGVLVAVLKVRKNKKARHSS